MASATLAPRIKGRNIGPAKSNDGLAHKRERSGFAVSTLRCGPRKRANSYVRNGARAGHRSTPRAAGAHARDRWRGDTEPLGARTGGSDSGTTQVLPAPLLRRSDRRAHDRAAFERELLGASRRVDRRIGSDVCE